MTRYSIPVLHSATFYFHTFIFIPCNWSLRSAVALRNLFSRIPLKYSSFLNVCVHLFVYKWTLWKLQVSRDMKKTTIKWLCAQRRLRSAWSSTQSGQSSLSAWRNLGPLATHWVYSEDSDQTGRMPRLIWVFTGHTLILLVLSCRGSNNTENP